MGYNRYHLYQKERGKTYNYIDRVLKSYLEQGGALFHVYKLLYTVDKNGNKSEIGSGQVADSVLNENPYRKYSREVYDLYGVTKMNTPKWVFSIEGYTDLDGDEKEIVVHYNSMIAQLGRKIICGDVIEISWIRDLDVLGADRAYNKFYQVVESCREESSWDPSYKFHLWKLKIKPITDSSEFADLFNYNELDPNPGYGEGVGNGPNPNGPNGPFNPNNPNNPPYPNGGSLPFYEDIGSINGGGGLDPSKTTSDTYLALNDAILKEADELGPNYRLHDEHHVYLDSIESLYDEYGRFIPSGIDGIARELNCKDIPFGDTFPTKPSAGDYYLRIDYFPCRLYVREVNEETQEGKWTLIEYDAREKWTGAPAIVRRAINMEGQIKRNDGSKINKQQNIKDLVPARVKKEKGKERPWDKITLVQPNTDQPHGI